MVSWADDEDLGERVGSDVSAFAGDGSQGDDVATLVLEGQDD